MIGESITRRSQDDKVTGLSKTDKKMIITMVSDDQEKENRGPVGVENTKASSSLADIGSKEALTKVRKKMSAAEEFHLPPYVSSMPTSNTLASMMSTMSLTSPFSPHITPPPLNQNHQPESQCHRCGGAAWLQRLQHGAGHLCQHDLSGSRTRPKDSSVSLSCTTQMALVNPKSRMLQYGPRVEIQCVKNAKIYPRGISFTANNMALVYLLDEAGARSTSDMFHDLYATQKADTLLMESCQREGQAVCLA